MFSLRQRTYPPHSVWYKLLIRNLNNHPSELPALHVSNHCLESPLHPARLWGVAWLLHHFMKTQKTKTRLNLSLAQQVNLLLATNHIHSGFKVLGVKNFALFTLSITIHLSPYIWNNEERTQDESWWLSTNRSCKKEISNRLPDTVISQRSDSFPPPSPRHLCPITPTSYMILEWRQLSSIFTVTSPGQTEKLPS